MPPKVLRGRVVGTVRARRANSDSVGGGRYYFGSRVLRTARKTFPRYSKHFASLGCRSTNVGKYKVVNQVLWMDEQGPPLTTPPPATARNASVARPVDGTAAAVLCKRVGGYVTRFEGGLDFLTVRGAASLVDFVVCPAPDDTAPFASADHLQARAAPTHHKERRPSILKARRRLKSSLHAATKIRIFRSQPPQAPGTWCL